VNDLPEQHGTEFGESFEMMVHLIGEEASWKICEYFQGEQVCFPKSILQLRRNREIRAKFKAGKMYYELSREYGLTTRWIRCIVHGKAASDEYYSQIDLFNF